MERFIVIDGNSLINRAYYALPPLNGSDGKPTQAVYGFVTMLIKLMEYKPSYMAVAFDLKAPTFRHKRYEQYKANRKGMPDDLAVQLPILKDLLREMGITVVEKEGFEADDIIGTMAKSYGGPTYIVTGDRDSFQLIDETTEVIMTKRGITETTVYNAAQLSAEYSLTPQGVVVYKALAGDSSDNIPGVPGVGAKTATELVNRFETLENIYANIDEIKGKLREKLLDGKNSAYMSLVLATIIIDVPDLPRAENCKVVFPFGDNIRTQFEKLNFRSLIKRDELFSTCAACTPLPECEILDLNTFRALIGEIRGDVPLIFDTTGVYFAHENKAYRLPIRQSLIDDGVDESEAADAIKALCESDNLKIVYDAKTLKKRLAPHGITLNNFFDVELCQYLVNSTVDHESLIRLGEYYQITGGLPLVLEKVYRIVKEQLGEYDMNDLYFKLELPLIDVLFDMERTGFKLDLAMLDDLNLRYGVEIEGLRAQIIDLAGREFNINSPKQLATVLFDELGIPYPKRSKTYSTGAEILEPLKGRFPIVDKVLRYRFLSKLKSTYLDGFKPLIDGEGVIHTEFRQMLTNTGRLSSIEPNLQNIPIRTEEGRLLRKLFVARDGNVLISADYSQIELRLMAHLSGDPIMVDAYNRGEDIHASTAAEIYGVPLSEVTPDMRREAKTVNFGIIYGISDYGLAQNLGISPGRAKAYIEKYFEKFGGVKSYLKETVALAYERGYVTTLYGRRRYIPELRASNHAQRMFGERVAMNTPLQGSAADIIKAAMIDVARKLSGMKSKLILQIHDELIIDAAEEEAERVKEILVSSMENVMKLRVPLKVEVGCGKRWFDCK